MGPPQRPTARRQSRATPDSPDAPEPGPALSDSPQNAATSAPDTSWALPSAAATALLAHELVDVRSGITRPEGVRVELQIHAICVRGPS